IVHPVSVAWEGSVYFRDSWQIAIRTPRITHIPQPRRNGQVGKDLPGITDVEPDAIVRPQASCREAQRGFLSGVALAVADDGLVHVFVRRIRVHRPIGPDRAAHRVPDSLTTCIDGSTAIHVRRSSEEAGIPAALNVVPAGAESDDVLAPRLAAVVLQLVIRLRRALRGQKVRAYRKAAVVDANRIICEGDT